MSGERPTRRPDALYLIFPIQIVALTTTYVSNMKVGIDMMTPTIIIGAVTEKRNNGGSGGGDPLSDISEEQISWIGE